MAITLVCDLVGAAGSACEISAGDATATALVIISCLVGLAFGVWQYYQIAAIHMPSGEDTDSTGCELIAAAADGDEAKNLISMNQDAAVTHQQFQQLTKIYNTVGEGAAAFLKAQYGLCCIFTVAFSVVVLILTSSSTESECGTATSSTSVQCESSHVWDWTTGVLTAISFAVGAFTSIISGLIGMKVAVFANGRVTVEAVKPGAQGWRGSFNAAFIAGSVMGYLLCGLALLVLFILINIFASFDDYSMDTSGNSSSAKRLFECIAGYGLGGSSMALFGRVGGGIFTKAADVGADLSGKVAGVKMGDKMFFLDEDSPLNPATIADNVGDNVGDVAGMGSDLFGSFAEASCAALVISASSAEIRSVGNAAYMFPLLVSGVGILVCMLTSFLATHVQKVAKHSDVECVLKVQLFVSSLLMTIATLPLALAFLPSEFTFEDLHIVGGTKINGVAGLQSCTRLGAWVCVVCGLWGGCLIGFVTEYYTSHSYKPVREVAQSCESGAATNIIYGLALGYLSCIIPILLLSINVFVAFSLCGMYGVALAALGMLGTLATCLSIDVYGPIADNAGGLAEMAEFPSFVREKTDALDAAGNTTAAIGKGFAIGSAALVSLALFGGFVSRLAAHSVGGAQVNINVLRPITFAFLFYGAMLPYWFTAYCMKSVGKAAAEMVANVKKQFSEGSQHLEVINDELRIKEGAPFPQYHECISISTNASLKEMVPPAMLVMGTPIIVGVVFGVEAVCGLLVGSLISAVQLAISQSNSGGAWDNAKKYVEQKQVSAMMVMTHELAESLGHDFEHEGHQCDPSTLIGQEVLIPQGKKTDMHKAAVVGDTVGDPLKDTSGPALNIVMKLMAILSLVFSDFFVSINDGRGLLKMPTDLDLACPATGCQCIKLVNMTTVVSDMPAGGCM